MTFEELNDLDQRQFNLYFSQHPKAIALNKKRNKFMAAGEHIRAIKVTQDIEELREIVFKRWFDELLQEARQVDIQNLNLPDEVKSKMNTYYVTLFMACDIINCCVVDMDNLIQKFHKDLAVEMFDDFIEMSRKAKEKIAMFQRNTGFLNDIYWGDKCDDIYDMMQNKAKKIIMHNKEKDGKQKSQECH